MKAMITGSNGTVGTALRHYLSQQRVECVGWDRAQVPIDNYAAMEAFIIDHQPDMLFHLATASQPTGRKNEAWLINIHWTSELAWLARMHDIAFVFTSTVMVFTDDAVGPFAPQSIPDAKDGYGAEKLAAEQRVFAQNPQARVARLGWQIGADDGSNNMVYHLSNQMRQNGQINASQRWLPACSFLDDTAAVLYNIAQADAGLYLVDANDHWNFYEIVNALKVHLGVDWQVVADDSFEYDQRMQDERVAIASLGERLPTLNIL